MVSNNDNDELGKSVAFGFFNNYGQIERDIIESRSLLMRKFLLAECFFRSASTGFTINFNPVKNFTDTVIVSSPTEAASTPDMMDLQIVDFEESRAKEEVSHSTISHN